MVHQTSDPRQRGNTRIKRLTVVCECAVFLGVFVVLVLLAMLRRACPLRQPTLRLRCHLSERRVSTHAQNRRLGLRDSDVLSCVHRSHRRPLLCSRRCRARWSLVQLQLAPIPCCRCNSVREKASLQQNVQHLFLVFVFFLKKKVFEHFYLVLVFNEGATIGFRSFFSKKNILNLCFRFRFHDFSGVSFIFGIFPHFIALPARMLFHF